MTLVVYELFTLNFLGCSTANKSGAKVYIARANMIVKLLFVGRGYFSTFQPVPSVKLTRFWSTFLFMILHTVHSFSDVSCFRTQMVPKYVHFFMACNRKISTYIIIISPSPFFIQPVLFFP